MVHDNRNGGPNLNCRTCWQEFNQVEVKHRPIVNRGFCRCELFRAPAEQNAAVVDAVTGRNFTLRSSYRVI